MNYKRRMVSPFNLFAMLFICRILVVFMACTGRIKGEYSSDIVISAAVSLAVLLVVSIPAVYAASSKMNILDKKPVSYAYGIYFTYLGAISVGQFVTLAIADLDRNSRALFLAALIIAACVYAASLGIEAVSRFSSMIFAVTLIGIAMVIIFGISDFSLINLFPFTRNGVGDIGMNALGFLCDSNEILLLLVLAPHVNGRVKKPFYFAVLSSFAICIILILAAVGVLGDAASLAAFPFYEFSQVLKLSKTERLDAIFTAFWIFAAFIKTSLFIYGASVSMKPLKQKHMCVFSGLFMFVLVWIIIKNDYFIHSERMISAVLLALFGIVIPLIVVLFNKKSKGEKLLESF